MNHHLQREMNVIQQAKDNADNEYDNMYLQCLLDVIPHIDALSQTIQGQDHSGFTYHHTIHRVLAMVEGTLKGTVCSIVKDEAEFNFVNTAIYGSPDLNQSHLMSSVFQDVPTKQIYWLDAISLQFEPCEQLQSYGIDSLVAIVNHPKGTLPLETVTIKRSQDIGLPFMPIRHSPIVLKGVKAANVNTGKQLESLGATVEYNDSGAFYYTISVDEYNRYRALVAQYAQGLQA